MMLGRFFRSFIKRKEGTTAIEFSLLAIPYLFVSLGIIELSIMYASASLLEGATGSAARQVRTGQLQQALGDPATNFRDSICSYATILIDCNDVEIEVIPMDTYADFDSFAPVYDGDGNLVSQGFDAGGSDEIILIRTAYRYEMMTPVIGRLLAGADNSRLFMSTLVLQTEPYDFDGAGV